MKSIQRSFLTPRYVYNSSLITTKVHQRVTNLTPHWSSSIPKRYKQNAIHGDLCRAERISSHFNNEKFDNAGYPSLFTIRVIMDYEHKQNRRQQQEDEYIIPPKFLDVAKESVLAGFSYYPQNKLVAKWFSSINGLVSKC